MDSPIRVLLVEDNPGDARLIQEFLRSPNGNSTELQWVETLAAAVSILDEERPQVLLLDLNLPDSGGIGTFRRLRTRYPFLPIVILSGLDDDEVAAQAVAEGAQDFLSKAEVSESVLSRSIRYSLERMRALTQLKESEARYQALYEYALEMLVSLEPDSFLIADCNQTFSKTLGVPKDELRGTPLTAWFPPEERSRVEEELRAAQRGDSTPELEFFFYSEAGERVEVSASVQASSLSGGDQALIHCSFRNITARVRAEQQAARSTAQSVIRNRISDLFLSVQDDSVFDAVLTELLHLTESPFGLLGTVDSNDDLVVRSMRGEAWEACAMEDQEIILHRADLSGSLLGKALSQASVLVRNDGPFSPPAGHLDLRRVIASPIKNRDQAVGLLAVANKPGDYGEDDSETVKAVSAHIAPILEARLQRDKVDRARIQAEAELRELNQTLEERVRSRTDQLHEVNRELDSFAHSVSHDLRGPLRAIDGFGRLLKDHLGDGIDAEGARLIGVIRENTGKMGTLIDDLLEFSRVGRKDLQRTPIDMDRMVRAVWEEVTESDWATRGKVQIEPIYPARGDPSLLRQVWVNLLSNALKFTTREEDPSVRVSSEVLEDEVVFAVADNGVGFEMEHASKLFQVFERLHRQDEFPGTGVGLALASRIVQRHGGRIWAEGTVGQGATFRFSLPMKEEGNP